MVSGLVKTQEHAKFQDGCISLAARWSSRGACGALATAGKIGRLGDFHKSLTRLAAVTANAQDVARSGRTCLMSAVAGPGQQKRDYSQSLVFIIIILFPEITLLSE